MALSTSSHTQKKLAAATAKLMGQDAVVRAVGVGRAHPRMSPGATVAAGVFAVFVVAAFVAGISVFPGGPLLYFTYASVCPQRVVAITDRGIAVLSRSLWTGRADRLLTTLPMAAWQPQPDGNGAMLVFGEDRIGLRATEFERLGASAADTIASARAH